MKKYERVSLTNRLRYEFDKTLSKGPLALGSWVALLSVLVILLLSAGVYFSRVDPELSLPAIVWTMLLQALAPNPVDFNAGPWLFLLAMLVITLLGLFMVSIFIGIITTSIESKVQSLRKGRSQIIEKGHTVILGWDEHIFTIISELMTTNQEHTRACLVILGDKDKVEMEDEIRARFPNTGRMEIVCRSGSPIDMTDLRIVSLNTAKSIIVLAPEGAVADTFVIKALLAILNNPGRRAEPYHIVTEIHDAYNLEAARLVGKGEATILLISDIIAHIIAQTCRQSGLSVVYTELLNFEGDEIYFKDEPSLVGRTFGESLFLYQDSCVIGIRTKGGKPKLNPPMDTVIGSGDQMIVVSEDDDTIHLSRRAAAPIQLQCVRLREPSRRGCEATLILGWNRRGATIIAELDHYVDPGSTVMVVTTHAESEGEVNQLIPSLKNQSVTHRRGDISNRRLLDSLCVENYQHVIVLADLDGESAQLTDARTLIALLHLRDINERTGQKFSIVSEMLDVRNRNLAEVTHVDDFIVSDELASLLMAQISENKQLAMVFDDLFYPEGSEIFLKPIVDYIRLEEPVNFYTVVEAARQRGEVALGYRQASASSDAQMNFGLAINPDKNLEILFHPEDKVIVLAED